MRFHFGEYTLDEDRREVLCGAESVHLSPKAFQLLLLLAARHPRTCSKQEIFDVVWADTFVAESNLPILVKEIRTALHDDAREPRIVRTVFGHGYALASAVTKQEPAARSLTSIAVLPLTNVAGPDWDYVAEGVSDSLINSLARLRAIRVLPRSTSFRYSGSGETPAEIGRKLRVDCVCSGRLRVSGDELAVQTELIHVPTDALIWGERFTRRLSSFADLQAEIVGAIASRLRIEMQHESVDVPSRVGEAYRLYLLGKHYWNRRDARSFKRAVESFTASTELDPLFAPAHAAMAETCVALASREALPSREIFQLARRAALRAIELDARLSAAHTALAAVYELFDWEWSKAEETHLRAIDLDPQYATAAQWYALHLGRRGRHAEADRWMSKALLLEPASTIINTNAALVAYLARDFERAVALGTSAIELDPEFEGARLITSVARIQTDAARATAEFDELATRFGRGAHIISNLAYASARAGRAADARAIRQEIESEAEQSFVSAAHRAIAALACEDRESAIAHVCAAADAHSPWLSYLRTDIRLDLVRSDDRVLRIEAQIGF